MEFKMKGKWGEDGETLAQRLWIGGGRRHLRDRQRVELEEQTVLMLAF